MWEVSTSSQSISNITLCTFSFPLLKILIRKIFNNRCSLGSWRTLRLSGNRGLFQHRFFIFNSCILKTNDILAWRVFIARNTNLLLRETFLGDQHEMNKGSVEGKMSVNKGLTPFLKSPTLLNNHIISQYRTILGTQRARSQTFKDVNVDQRFGVFGITKVCHEPKPMSQQKSVV